MKKLTALSIIVILILLASGTFLYTQNQSLENEINVLNNKIEELQKQKPEPVRPEPITEKIPEGWKEYMDEEYKFRIWYPQVIDYGAKGMVLVTKDKERPDNFYNKEYSSINFMKSSQGGKEEPIDLLYIYI